MHKALKKIGELKELKNCDDKAWKDLSACSEVNESRRRVSHYFLRALDLYENKKCINKRFLKIICESDGFELLYEVVEHLEKALNSKYNRAKFDRLLKLCGRSEDIERLGEVRPKNSSKAPC